MKCEDCKNIENCKDKKNDQSFCGCVSGIPSNPIIKPCPFCGKFVKILSESHRMENFVNKPTIICDNCGYGIEKDSRFQLIQFWNKRA